MRARRPAAIPAASGSIFTAPTLRGRGSTLGSAEPREDPLGDERPRLGARVVTVPGDEARHAHLPVAADLVDHLLGRADEVAGLPAVERLTERGSADGAHVCLGLAHEDLGAPGLLDLVVVAAHGVAVTPQHVALVGELLRI